MATGGNRANADDRWELHPDGKSWKKCCNDGIPCAFYKPPNTDGLSRYDCSLNHSSKKLKKNMETVPFVCEHRTDEGFYRVCAGWQATYGRKLKK